MTNRLPEEDFELKLADGRMVTWTGRGPEDAAVRYADAHRGDVVVAWRRPRYGLFVGARRIIEPGESEW